MTWRLNHQPQPHRITRVYNIQARNVVSASISLLLSIEKTMCMPIMPGTTLELDIPRSALIVRRLMLT